MKRTCATAASGMHAQSRPQDAVSRCSTAVENQQEASAGCMRCIPQKHNPKESRTATRACTGQAMTPRISVLDRWHAMCNGPWPWQGWPKLLGLLMSQCLACCIGTSASLHAWQPSAQSRSVPACVTRAHANISPDSVLLVSWLPQWTS